jgi:hypothetical protein
LVDGIAAMAVLDSLYANRLKQAGQDGMELKQ